MLVDDNYPILMYFAEQIPWDELGMTVIGAFENGLKALEQAKVNVPDILITDIGMPVMNGLELIEKVQKLNPDVLSLIISCHDEFSYAQRAIQLKVGDYILKGAINLDLIVERLKIFKSILKGRTKQKPSLQGEEELEMLKTQWIRNTLNCDFWDTDRWADHALNYGIDVKHRVCIPILGVFHNSLQVQHHKNLSDTLFGYATANMISELISKYRNCVYFQYSHSAFFLIVTIDKDDAVNVEPVMHQLMELRAELYRIMTLNTSFMIGSKSNAPQGLLSGLHELWNRRDAVFYLDNRIITTTKDIVFSSEDIYAYYLNVLDQFRLCIFGEETDRIEPTVNDVIGWLRAERFHPGLVKEFMSKIVIDMQIEIRNIQSYQHLRVEESIHEMMSNLNSPEEVGFYVRQFLVKTVSLMEGMYHQSKRKEIIHVQRFILTHMDRNISLHEVAKHLHMNHSYLSRLFKKETGENFIDYTMRMKVKRAQELLDKTEKSIEEIAGMIGYESAYFYKIFKKMTGFTPSEYRTDARAANGRRASRVSP